MSLPSCGTSNDTVSGVCSKGGRGSLQLCADSHVSIELTKASSQQGWPFPEVGGLQGRVIVIAPQTGRKGQASTRVNTGNTKAHRNWRELAKELWPGGGGRRPNIAVGRAVTWLRGSGRRNNLLEGRYALSNATEVGGIISLLMRFQTSPLWNPHLPNHHEVQ